MDEHPRLALADYRREVAVMYARARNDQTDSQLRWHQYRRDRETLIGRHIQSPLDESQRADFQGLTYFDYDPRLCFLLELDAGVEPGRWEVDLPEDGLLRFERLGRVHFHVDDHAVSLSVFWLLGYGGGLFLPFRDQTCADLTYPAGRYLLDTIKGADLGSVDGRLVIDFNYAYNPSCAYNARWHCPLAPVENWLPVAIRAGELRYPAAAKDGVT